MLLYIRPERRRVRIDIYLLRDRPLRTQLPRTVRTEIGNLFLQQRFLRDGRRKSARGRYALLQRQLRDVYHVLSAQLLPCQQTGFVQQTTRKSSRFFRELQRRRHTRIRQLGLRTSAYPPYIAYLE